MPDKVRACFCFGNMAGVSEVDGFKIASLIRVTLFLGVNDESS